MILLVAIQRSSCRSRFLRVPMPMPHLLHPNLSRSPKTQGFTTGCYGALKLDDETARECG